MAEQQQNQPETGAQPQPAGAPKPWLIGPLKRLPPRYQQLRWIVGGAAGAALLIFVMGDCMLKASAAPEPEPAPVAAATPTPEPTAIPREEYQLPRQYAFVHFVNEMSACYDQNGQPATLETVEADIMRDVPSAVGILMRLYADNACQEVEPWHQIPGRAGWMLRASGINEHLPEPPEPQGEESK